MKHTGSQFDARRNPGSPRMDGLHLAVNSSSASLRNAVNSCEKGELVCSQPTVSSRERSEWQIEHDASFEPLLDAAEAARLLRIHPKTLQKLTRVGHVPAYRVGRFWRYRGSDLEMWLRSGANSKRQPADGVDFTEEKTQ